MAKIAINGFGRIGRLFLRQALGEPELEIVAVNDLGDLENLAYLLKYDTVYGRCNKKIEADKEKRELLIDKRKIKFFQEKDPLKLPWKDLAIDIVIESTGAFESYEKARAHILAGAKKVIITAPAKDADTNEAKTVLVGINENELQACELISNGSCTTNAVAPVMAVLSENPGIAKAVLNTVHGYTASQNLVDAATKGQDFRRGRAAGQNIVPSTTGAALTVSRVLPELAGKFDGLALRVPIITGSIADITFLAKRKTSVEEINEILRRAAASPRLQGILAVTEDQIVSSDIVGEPYAAIVDLKFTKVIDGDLVKVFSWYDNEWGYAAMLVRQVKNLAQLL